MCGICGIFNSVNAEKLNAIKLTRMLDMIRHRGPDDSGIHVKHNNGIAHCRLSIIDLSPNGQQPMSNEDGSVWITYNGEFYNYREYIDELKRDGHYFRSKSDTEVIIHLYEKYGLEETIRKMKGMFAFCLWDKRKKVQYLVRDRFGIKPLYYYCKKAEVYFSSEIKAFYAIEDFYGQIRHDKVQEYFLFSRSLDNETLLESVFEVRPGTYVELKEGELREVMYYDLSQVKQNTSISESEALEEFDCLLGQAIKRRLVSDVPVGVFLSGGLDSSIIALKMAEILDDPITTISVGYPETSANEFYWSDQIVRKIQSRHHKFLVTSDNFRTLFPRLTYIHDAPLATVGVGFYLAAKVAKSQCTVMLCGQGSDEVFGGYTSYIYSKYQSKLNHLIKHILSPLGATVLSDLLPRIGNHKVFRKVAARIALDDDKITASYASGLPRDDFIKFLKDGDETSYRNLLNKYAEQFYPANRSDFLNDMLVSEMNHGLQIRLQETDRMTMACAVETRVPFLDHELVEFALSLPSSMKVKDGEGKHLLKKYLAQHLPRKFVYRKKKGFPTPIYEWINDTNHAIHKLIEYTGANDMVNFFNTSYISEYISFARSGNLGKHVDVFAPVVSFLCLKIWFDGVNEATGRRAVKI